MSNCSEFLQHGTGPLDPENGNYQDGRFIIAACGHEVFSGEYLYEWEDGESLCPDCLEEKFDDLPIYEKARLLGCDWEMIT